MVISMAFHVTDPIWVKFFNVPFEHWNHKGFCHVANVVDKPLCVDSLTESKKQISFMRNCVEVDASEPLIDSFDLVVQPDKEREIPYFVEVRVKFQCKHHIGFHCKTFGHLEPSCPHKPKPAPIEIPTIATSEKLPTVDHEIFSTPKLKKWRRIGKALADTSAIQPLFSPSSPVGTLPSVEVVMAVSNLFEALEFLENVSEKAPDFLENISNSKIQATASPDTEKAPYFGSDGFITTVEREIKDEAMGFFQSLIGNDFAIPISEVNLAACNLVTSPISSDMAAAMVEVDLGFEDVLLSPLVWISNKSWDISKELTCLMKYPGSRTIETNSLLLPKARLYQGGLPQVLLLVDRLIAFMRWLSNKAFKKEDPSLDLVPHIDPRHISWCCIESGLFPAMPIHFEFSCSKLGFANQCTTLTRANVLDVVFMTKKHVVHLKLEILHHVANANTFNILKKQGHLQPPSDSLGHWDCVWPCGPAGFVVEEHVAIPKGFASVMFFTDVACDDDSSTWVGSISKGYVAYWLKCFIAIAKFHGHKQLWLSPSIVSHPRLVLEPTSTKKSRALGVGEGKPAGQGKKATSAKEVAPIGPARKTFSARVSASSGTLKPHEFLDITITSEKEQSFGETHDDEVVGEGLATEESSNKIVKFDLEIGRHPQASLQKDTEGENSAAENVDLDEVDGFLNDDVQVEGKHTELACGSS
ncbi:hypothetical protein D8674_000125 [Pyrus ussuriensis x Pyrus communis]|uniref:Uncharacterized protein n=1 Tax=Pyrus ussuriensis x Pyrus communis TaxID=2448454 RepID=A0A5N5F2J8_9ROSA|nr:hypothetical protein D8674_000125 [Pyrus ussuriensis x Pyrus communis]